MKKLVSLLVMVCMVVGLCAGAFAYAPGAYSAGAAGMNGEVTVEVTFAEDKIDKVEVVSHSESAGISDPAIERIPAAIVDGQTLSIDAVSGATFTSNAILNAVADCVAQAGGDVEALKSAAPAGAVAGEKTQSEMETDVLVVGGGIAGLSAALTAAGTGVKVALIDKMPAVGGTTAISGGYLIAQGSKLYAADANEYDNLDGFISYWEERMAYSSAQSGYPDWARLRGVLGETGRTIDFLSENGVPWGEHVFVGFGPYPVAACNGGGANLVATMLDACVNKGVTVLTECKAQSLMVEDGEVVGALCETNDSIVTFKAKSVVLATGGISQNQELVAKYSPKISAAGVIPISAVSSTGDGLVMAIDAGAGVFDEFATAICATTVDPALGALADASGLTTAAQLGVNNKGERFASESALYYDALASDMIQDGNAPFWYIYDSANSDLSAVLESGAQAGCVAKGETVQELAGAMGVDAGALEATFARYAELVAAGNDEDLGKDKSLLVALEKAPYYAVKFYPTTFGSVGGVLTSEEGRVLRQDGSVLEGLYAAGEMSNRYFYNENYILAASLGLYATMGHRAGATAAADAAA